MALEPTPFTLGGGLLNGDSFLNPDENTAGGLTSPDSVVPDWADNGMNKLQMLHGIFEQIQAVGTQAYGTNAAQRWSGTSAVGLSMFKGMSPATHSAPIYKDVPQAGGGFRPTQQIDGSTHMAHPPEGLIGGKAMENMMSGKGTSSLTPEAEWTAKFGAKGANGVRTPGGNGGGMSNTDWQKTFGSDTKHPAYAY
jgi:hypothetical protein